MAILRFMASWKQAAIWRGQHSLRASYNGRAGRPASRVPAGTATHGVCRVCLEDGVVGLRGLGKAALGLEPRSAQALHARALREAHGEKLQAFLWI